MNFQVWRVDDVGKYDNIGYGVANLPNTTGHFTQKIPIWRPMKGWMGESNNYFLGTPPTLQTTDPVSTSLEHREALTTIGSGNLYLSVDVILAKK